MTQEIITHTWSNKYKFVTDVTQRDSMMRVHNALMGGESDEHRALVRAALADETMMPGGRIIAGAGTGLQVTLFNCFVSPRIQDSMATIPGHPDERGIMDALSVAALTQQMGGGIGMDFSTLRPRGASVARRAAAASGPLHFMDMWNAMCGTVMAAGQRRGAMMATLLCSHPDIREFISAKHEEGRLTNFNVSVLVTHEFMEAVSLDKEWELHFPVPRLNGEYVRIRDDGSFVYDVVRARDLWDEMIRSTYEFAEPGIIFIDTVNYWNNLGYIENIMCTNPCGEQPLPPNANCNLLNTVLAKMVDEPFSDEALFNYDLLDDAARAAIILGNQVIDKSLYPTLQQKVVGMDRRRIGLGVTGLGNTLQMLGLRYGSEPALETVKKIMCAQKLAAYWQSVRLAEVHGPFPAYNREEFLRRPFIANLPEDLRDAIAEKGIRNGLLLTIAPTGTTSLIAGNVSSGLEPTFSWRYYRKVLRKDEDGKDAHDEFLVEDYGWRVYREVHGLPEDAPTDDLPSYMVTTDDLNIEDHLRTQAVCQEEIDSSISKTINVPEDYSFEDFKRVYTRAYDLGLKGCTTYRPSDVRGAVLSKESSKASEAVLHMSRPSEVPGLTYKMVWPGSAFAWYVTINNVKCRDGVVRPFEMFINTKDVSHLEWVTALALCTTAVFRKVVDNCSDSSFLVEELESVFSPDGGAWKNKKFIPSRVANIGMIIRKHLESLGLEKQEQESSAAEVGERCPVCQAPTLIYKEGCATCVNCGHSNCG